MSLQGHVSWKRKWEDPLATKQVWYCTVCEAKYKTTNGVMVQFLHEGKSSFVRAEFPPAHFQQIKFGSVQRSHADASTPTELLDLIPEAAIAPSNIIMPVEGKQGTYVYDREALENLPMMNWQCLLNPSLTNA